MNKGKLRISKCFCIRFKKLDVDVSKDMFAAMPLSNFT